MNPHDLFLGLHIPKTAGTTLHAHISRHARPGSAYLCSSFLNNRNVLAELDFPERRGLKNIHIAFGHYTQLALINILGAESPYLFTFVRDPIAIQVSSFFQINRVKRIHDKPLIDAQQYVAGISLSLEHWMRGFFYGDPRGDDGGISTLDLFRCFDCVIDVDHYDGRINELTALMGLPLLKPTRINETNASEKSDRFLSEQAALIKVYCEEHCREEVALYQQVRSVLTRSGEQCKSFREESGMSLEQRNQIFAACLVGQGIDTYQDFLAEQYIAEARTVGILDETEAYLREKRAWLDQILAGVMEHKQSH